jgi:hypothetical protein
MVVKFHEPAWPGLRVTICPSRAVTIGSELVDMIGTSRSVT